MKYKIPAIFLIMILLMVTSVLAGTLTRSVPSTVNPGGSFTVTYSMTAADAEDFVAWHDTISGGCSPSLIEDFMTRTAGDTLPKTVTKTITVPSSGSCTLSGYYQFAGGSQINFATQTISIQTTVTTTNPPSSTNPSVTTTTQSTPVNECDNFWNDPKDCTKIAQWVWWAGGGVLILLISSGRGR